MSPRNANDVVWRDVKKPRDTSRRDPTPRGLSVHQYAQGAARGTSELLESYAKSAWLQAVVNRIGYHFAVVPWQLHERPNRRLPGKRLSTRRYQFLGGEFRHKSLSNALRLGDLNEVEEHPILDLLNSPNPQMGGVAFRDLCCKFVDFTGECFQLIIKDALGIPFQLWPLPPTWCTRIPTPDRPTYEFSIMGLVIEARPDEVIYVRRHELMNPFGRGTGIGTSLGDTVDMDAYAHKFVKSFYHNGARPDMIISVPGASEEVIANLQNKFENQTRGPLKAHRTFFVDDELQVQELQNTVGAEQSLPLFNHIRDTIISIYGVPPEIMGVLENANRATINQAMTIFARETLMPRLELFADEWQRQLVPLFDENLLLSYANPVPEDDDYRLDVARAAPWSLSAREWRQLGGWQNTADTYDFHMVPVGLTATSDPAVPILAPGQPGGLDGAPTPAGLLPQGDGLLPETSPATNTGQSLSQVTLNGAQMEGILTILSQVVQGALPRESAVELILVAVPISREQAENILGPIGTTFEPKVSPQDVAPPTFDPQKAYVAKASDDVADAVDAVLDGFAPEYLAEELDPVWRSSVAKWGDQTLAELNIDARFDMQNPRVKGHLKEFAGERIKGINGTTRDNLTRELTAGFQAGENYRDIAARVKQVMGTNETRAEIIARTEVMRSSNFSSFDAYKQSGVIAQKRWIATVSDDRTRDSHLALNGEVVGIDDDFEVGGSAAAFPGDFGDPGEDINCRCTVGPVVDDEPKSADDLAITWKAYDGRARAWEARARDAILKAWNKQQRAILTALAAVSVG